MIKEINYNNQPFKNCWIFVLSWNIGSVSASERVKHIKAKIARNLKLIIYFISI